MLFPSWNFFANSRSFHLLASLQLSSADFLNKLRGTKIVDYSRFVCRPGVQSQPGRSQALRRRRRALRRHFRQTLREELPLSTNPWAARRGPRYHSPFRPVLAARGPPPRGCGSRGDDDVDREHVHHCHVPTLAPTPLSSSQYREHRQDHNSLSFRQHVRGCIKLNCSEKDSMCSIFKIYWIIPKTFPEFCSPSLSLS